MDPATRRRYLEVMGIDVYVRRGLPEKPPAVVAPAIVSDLEALGVRGPESTLDWDALAAKVAACERCELHRTRTQTVFARGDRGARWMVVGEAPGAEEDRQGEPFV